MSIVLRRIAVVVASVAGLFAVSIVAGFAAPPLPTATAGPDGASAAAIEQPGVVAVSKSTTSPEGEVHWTALEVAGTEVYGRGRPGEYTGAAAGAGPTLASVNQALCPVAVGNGACVLVLPGGGADNFPFGPFTGYYDAGGRIAYAEVSAGTGANSHALSVDVLPSSSRTFVAKLVPCATPESKASLAVIGINNGGNQQTTDLSPAAASYSNGNCP